MVEQQATVSPANDCTHHWQIETPAGETSEGVCKLCGARRLFANYSQPQAAGRAAKAAASRARVG